MFKSTNIFALVLFIAGCGHDNPAIGLIVRDSRRRRT